MKLNNAQIREANRAFLFLSKLELECFIPICMNVIELEAPAKKVEEFIGKVAVKNGWLSEDKTQIVIPAADLEKFSELTDGYMKKTTDVRLEPIKRKQLEGDGVKIPADLIVALVKMKIIV